MTTTSPDQYIVTPGNLLANIPGILGYYPHESFVLFVFQAHRTTGRLYELGPVLRADIDDPEAIVELCRAAQLHDPSLILGAIISTGTDADTATDVAEETILAFRDLGLDIAAIWLVPELLSGAPYLRVAGESASELGENTTGREFWDAGEVGNILDAASMANYRRTGTLPALNRQETVEFCSGPNPYMTPAEITSATSFAHQHAESMLAALMRCPEEDEYRLAEAILCDWGELLSYVLNSELTVEDIMADADIIAQAAPYFTNHQFRDCILDSTFTSLGQAAFLVAIAVARSTEKTVRANALAVAALAAGPIGMEHYVAPALQVALETVPDHGLANLLSQAHVAGGLYLVAQACVKGSEQARAQLFGLL
ncbi:DUF4192 family protein [Corynebacterium epidermidicanis]|nr:DUF4192 family protein [Corynebacterium epidermidicanis]